MDWDVGAEWSNGGEAAGRKHICYRQQKKRQQALAAQKTWREQRAAVEKRREGWALDVAVAIAERDLCEQRVGIGLAKLVDDGLSLEDAVQWTGGALSIKQARALIANAETADDDREHEAAPA